MANMIKAAIKGINIFSCAPIASAARHCRLVSQKLSPRRAQRGASLMPEASGLRRPEMQRFLRQPPRLRQTTQQARRSQFIAGPDMASTGRLLTNASLAMLRGSARLDHTHTAGPDFHDLSDPAVVFDEIQHHFRD